MPIKIVDYNFPTQEPVEPGIILETVEKNRDRLRTTAGMLLTLSGILISFSAAFLIFVSDKAPNEHRTIGIFAVAVVAFITSSVIAISATFLRTKYAISYQSKFLSDLLALYSTELRLLRVASVVTIVGLILVASGAASFVINRVSIP